MSSAQGIEIEDRREFGILFVHSALDDYDITPKAFRVYAHICRRTNRQSGYAWPSYRDIGDACFSALSDKPDTRRRWAINAVKELKDHRMIIVEQRTKENGSYSSNKFVLTNPTEWMASPGGSDHTSLGGSDDTSPGVVTTHHHPSDDTSPHPPCEAPSKPSSAARSGNGVESEGNPGEGNPDVRTHPVGSSTPADPAPNGDNPQGQTAELIEDVDADARPSEEKYPRRSELPMKGPHYSYPEAFERFWSHYPRNDDKAAAYDVWRQRVRQGHDPDLIEQGAHAYALDMEDRGRELEKMKMPKTWLNADGWLEYLDSDGNFVGFVKTEGSQGKSLDELFGLPQENGQEGIVDV